MVRGWKVNCRWWWGWQTQGAALGCTNMGVGVGVMVGVVAGCLGCRGWLNARGLVDGRGLRGSWGWRQAHGGPLGVGYEVVGVHTNPKFSARFQSHLHRNGHSLQRMVTRPPKVITRDVRDPQGSNELCLSYESLL